MTREEAIQSVLDTPEALPILDLYALHQTLDMEVVELRRTMGVIDAEIAKREAAETRRGPAHLRQDMRPGSTNTRESG